MWICIRASRLRGDQDNVEDSEADQPRNEPGSTSDSTATTLPGTYPMAFLSMLDLMESDVRRSVPLPSSDYSLQAGSGTRNRRPIEIEPSASNATRARHESMEDSLNDIIRSILSPEHEMYLFERRVAVYRAEGTTTEPNPLFLASLTR